MIPEVKNDIALRLRWAEAGLDHEKDIQDTVLELIRGAQESAIVITLPNGNRIESRWNVSECVTERVYIERSGREVGRGPLFCGDDWDARILQAFAKRQQEEMDEQ